MSTKWANRLLYWALAIVPLAGVALVGRLYDPLFFLLLLLFYTLSTARCWIRSG